MQSPYGAKLLTPKNVGPFRIFMDLSSLTKHSRRPLEFSSNYRLTRDFAKAHCTKGFHSSTLGTVEDGALEQEHPTMLDIQNMIYGQLRDQIQPKAQTPCIKGGLEAWHVSRQIPEEQNSLPWRKH
jgi:hypothetical protein